MKRGKTELVHLLLLTGVDVSLDDYGGFMTLERARNWPDPEMTTIVQEYTNSR